MGVEQGITYPRLFELAELDAREQGRRMQEQAAAVNAAMAQNPQKAFRRLSPEGRRPITNDDVPSQLRIPRKRGDG